MASTSSITVQSLGKFVQRTPAVGAKMWFFVCHVQSPHAAVKVRPKTARNEQVCGNQKSQGNKFSKISLGLLCTWGTVVVPLYRGFAVRRQMAPQQSAKFRTAFLVNFFTSLRKDSVANYASIWTLFSPTVRGLDGQWAL